MIARRVPAVIGVYACFAIVPLAIYRFDVIACKSDKLEVAPLAVLFSIIFGGIFVFLYRKWDNFSTWFAYRGWEARIADYFAVAAIIASGYVYQIIFFEEWDGIKKWYWLFGAIILVLLIIFRETSCLCQKKREKRYVEIQQRFIFELSSEEMLDWAKDDNPPQEDFFNFTLKAEKIATRLINSINIKGNATIRLRGQYGSGKSTITELVENIVIEKKGRKDIIFVRADCWGFEDSQSALQYIIKKIIDGMTMVGLDTDHLTHIPQQYVRALAKTHTIFDIITELFREVNIPENVLKKIDNLLRSEGKKMVLILEDLDRNKNNDIRHDSVDATLRRLRNTECVSFVITDSYRKNEERLDFVKICDYVEEVPVMSFRDKSTCLATIAKHQSKGVVEPKDDNEILEKIPYLTEVGVYSALLELIDTPRTFKTIIRDLDVTWGKLRGECDYVELLALTILRNTDNSVFDFIVENLSILRNRDNEIREIVKENEIYKRHAQILEWLFFDNIKMSKTTRRIRNVKPVDYFSRIINEHVPDVERDQKQLRAIEDWNHSTDRKTLVHIIAGTDLVYLELHSRWLSSVNDASLLDLTKAVILELADSKIDTSVPLKLLSRQWHLVRDYESDKNYPRIVGGIEQKDRVPELLLPWFETIFSAILPNISLCAAVLHYFGRRHEVKEDAGEGIYLTRWHGLPSTLSREKILGVLESFVSREVITDDDFKKIISDSGILQGYYFKTSLNTP